MQTSSIEPAPGAAVEVVGVDMAFGDRMVFRGLSCAFAPGEISVVLGGSGTGKSTLLRMIGGLVRPQAGRILVAGDDVTRLSERALFRVRTKLGMMFQGGALLDSLTVFENVAFPLHEHTRLRPAEIAARARARLAAVGLAEADGALLPSQLSGGMIRRVALARATMLDPVILLCDEPFSGLDPVSVRRIERLLARINRSLAITMIIVSHDVGSTLRIADRAVLLLPGGAVVAGTPDELRHSTDPRVAAFLGADPDGDHEVEARAAAPGGRR
jgi:phospholipid/cholesterol/gamma-HCH transport system ATP-binding protein